MIMLKYLDLSFFLSPIDPAKSLCKLPYPHILIGGGLGAFWAVSVHAAPLFPNELSHQRSNKQRLKTAVKTEVVANSPKSRDSNHVSVTLFLTELRGQVEARSLRVLASRNDASSLPSLNEGPAPAIAAGPENFNPGIFKPIPPPEPPPPTVSPLPIEPLVFNIGPGPFLTLENLQVDFRHDSDNFGQRNLFIEPTFQFRVQEGDTLLQLKTGFNTFEKRNIETITNIPLKLSLQTEIENAAVKISAGIDTFNRLPIAFNFDAQVTIPVTQEITLSGVLEQGPYKVNGETLENQITAFRWGPNIYWQIDRNTSLFSSFRIGSFSDGNQEQQLFSRLERKLGQFYIAANVFSWFFTNDFQASGGYFSPPDFLVYNGEIGWEGRPFDFLRCRLNANLGQQRLNGKITNGNTYQARCAIRLSRQIELDLGYTFSNVASLNTGGNSYESQALAGQVKIDF